MTPTFREPIRIRGSEKVPGEVHSTNTLYSDKNLRHTSGSANVPSFSCLITIDVETFGNAGLIVSGF